MFVSKSYSQHMTYLHSNTCILILCPFFTHFLYPFITWVYVYSMGTEKYMTVHNAFCRPLFHKAIDGQSLLEMMPVAS